MKSSVMIFLVGAMVLVHAGATIHYLMSDLSCTTVAIGTEEEESHFGKQTSKTELQVIQNHFIDVISVVQSIGFYTVSISCKYEASRIDLPPERKV